AMNMALEKAKEVHADIVMATDPDADRVGIGVRDDNGEYILLNGNQAASLLIYYLVRKWSEKGRLTGKEYIVKTIVTSELLSDIAKKYGVECFNVLTGFKYIADIIKKNEGHKTFIGGGEESYGYLAGEFVRDKDAVMSCALLAETAAWAKDQGKTMYELLLDIYCEFGLYRESLKSVVRKGKDGAEEIRQMMADYRKNPPLSIDGQKVIMIKDYLLQTVLDLLTGEKKPIDLPKSDVLQFFTEDDSKISVRPSGTEPKIKFYFGIKETLKGRSDLRETMQRTDEKLARIKRELTE
ncbi:MAG: phospho-sugar mutase, partial [Bacteroidetes bacterium]|nr:phospho-sugar mutase [Bacteroidota bacterium]